MQDNSNLIAGVLPVFQTPFLEDEGIDFATLECELHWLLDEGADGVVMAMVSEVLRLDDQERESVGDFVCRTLSKRGPVVLSVGAESARAAEQRAGKAEQVGAAAVMAIPPTATRSLTAEVFEYYSRIVRAVSIPVIVQDASGYLGQPLPIELQARLLEVFGPDRVQFKPEAAPIGQRLSELRDATAGRARVFEGTGGIALVDSFQRGIVGTMPGADLIRALVPLWQALQTGDLARASRIHAPLSALITLQTSLDSFLAVEKHLLVRQGIFTSERVRGPRGFVLDPETRREVDRLFDLLLAAV